MHAKKLLRSLKLLCRVSQCYVYQISSCHLKFILMLLTKQLVSVLVQEKHPVAYESRKLNKAEQKCSAHEKEMIDVVHYLLACRVYLLGPKFVVRTNNVANTFFNTQKKLSPKQASWQELLQEYDFVWEHKPGKHNQVADALSRKQVQEYVTSLTRVK